MDLKSLNIKELLEMLCNLTNRVFGVRRQETLSAYFDHEIEGLKKEESFPRNYVRTDEEALNLENWRRLRILLRSWKSKCLNEQMKRHDNERTAEQIWSVLEAKIYERDKKAACSPYRSLSGTKMVGHILRGSSLKKFNRGEFSWGYAGRWRITAVSLALALFALIVLNNDPQNISVGSKLINDELKHSSVNQSGGGLPIHGGGARLQLADAGKVKTSNNGERPLVVQSVSSSPGAVFSGSRVQLSGPSGKLVRGAVGSYPILSLREITKAGPQLGYISDPVFVTGPSDSISRVNGGRPNVLGGMSTQALEVDWIHSSRDVVVLPADRYDNPPLFWIAKAPATRSR